ncbi:MAG: hypothetical protein ACREA9_20245 [Pyrinomonadaceae bacterium]
MRREKGKGEGTKGCAPHSRFVGLLKLAIAMLLIGGSGFGQDRTSDQDIGPRALSQCSEPTQQTSGSYNFRRQGESFDIQISGADCQAVALELRWSNGRNNGSNFHVIFLDKDNQAIYTKELSGFLTGNFLFPFTTIEPQPWLSSGSMMSVASVPVKVVIQTVRPFAFPANISYTVTRAAGQQRRHKSVVKSESEAVNKGKAQGLKGESADSGECASGKIAKP